ncbi:MAG TPA: hypothetical protein VHE54_08705 [Puia sp.]|nr:hypothetical protein [Puia sp.]
MTRDMPFDFILDYLLPIDAAIKPSFGMFYVYSGPRLLLILRERANEPELNGIWVATTRKGLETLTAEFPALGLFPGHEPKRKKSDAIWLVVHPDHDDFERTAIGICDLIAHRDPRIGRTPK